MTGKSGKQELSAIRIEEMSASLNSKQLVTEPGEGVEKSTVASPTVTEKPGL